MNSFCAGTLVVKRTANDPHFAERARVAFQHALLQLFPKPGVHFVNLRNDIGHQKRFALRFLAVADAHCLIRRHVPAIVAGMRVIARRHATARALIDFKNGTRARFKIFRRKNLVGDPRGICRFFVVADEIAAIFQQRKRLRARGNAAEHEPRRVERSRVHAMPAHKRQAVRELVEQKRHFVRNGGAIAHDVDDAHDSAFDGVARFFVAKKMCDFQRSRDDGEHNGARDESPKIQFPRTNFSALARLSHGARKRERVRRFSRNCVCPPE